MHESQPAAINVLPSNSIRAGSGAFQRVNPLDDAGWDAGLIACPSASFFHSAVWARVLHDTYGFQPVYFVHSDQEGLRSLLPVMEVNSWLTGRRGLSLPFTDECEPLCPDAGSFRSLFQETLNYATSRGWKYLECRGGRRLFGEAPASTSFFGHRLDLQHDEPSLWKHIHGSARRAVRKAERSGLTVEFSRDLDAVRTFHGLLCQTRKRHGVPPQPFRFFQNIHRHVLAQNQGQIILARLGRTPVAGALFFHFGKTAIFKFGASNDSFQQLRANNLIMWQAIKWHAREGFAALDLGRTSVGNEGLRKFKLNLGSKERRIEYVRCDLRTGGFVTARDESFGWYNCIFKMLPDYFTRLIGAALYKHIA